MERFFALVSRLGDGWLWYAVIAMLPLAYGTAALCASLHMALIGAAGVVIYKHLTSRLVRDRPNTTHEGVRLGGEVPGIGANVLFVGYLDRESALLDCYSAGDAFIFVSRTETQGLVLLETMALGVPVVSTADPPATPASRPQRGP